MMRTSKAFSAFTVWLLLVVAACGSSGTNASGVLGDAVSGLGQEWVTSQTTSNVFAAGVDTWVSFADAVVTFRVVEVSDGERQENITGTEAVQQFLTLQVLEVLWTSPTADRELPDPLVVQGAGVQLRDGEIISSEPAQVVSDQLFLGAIAYSANEDTWFDLSNSVARVGADGQILTPGHDLSSVSTDEIAGVLAATRRLDVNDSIDDPIERAYAYYDAQAALNVEPAPTVDPDFVKPCPPVDADEIPQDILDECAARLEAEDED